MSDLNILLLLEMTHDPVGPAEVQIQAITSCALQEMHDCTTRLSKFPVHQ